MADNKGHLYLFEAIELRNEYDRHIRLLKYLLEGEEPKRDRFFRDDKEEKREPTDEFDRKSIEEKLKKLQTKRVKLNQAIQVANFKYQMDFNGEKISIAEALELRKNFLADLESMKQQVIDSAYKTIIHKEERDIVHAPKQKFPECYESYLKKVGSIRYIVNQIHILNHESIVDFREE